jgi:hypothetical protein
MGKVIMDTFGETPSFIVTVVVLVAYELIKGLVARGLKTQEAVDKALWQQGVTDSLLALIKLTEHIRKDLDAHIIDERANNLPRRL